MISAPLHQHAHSTHAYTQGTTPSNASKKVIGDFTYNPRYCLGEGAFGKVYEGIDAKTQRKVAIKKLDMKQFTKDPYLHRQIISEIEILKRFNHRNIVRFHDMISTTNNLYIITEFCKDGDLRNLLKHSRLTEEHSMQVPI
jgi:calcium-dependent protein kinase